jgi:heat shock protein HslJ
MNRQESSLLEAFDNIHSWKVTADTLILSIKEPPVARFVAVYLR